MRKIACVALAALALTGCEIEVPNADYQDPEAVTFEPRPVSGGPKDRVPPTQKEFDSVEDALAAMATATDNDQRAQQLAAYNWLCTQGEPAVPAVATAMNDSSCSMDSRRMACRVLGQLGPAAKEDLMAASRSDEMLLRLKAIETMAAVEPPQQMIIRRLIRLVDDPNEQVQRAAIRSLGSIGTAAKASADKLLAMRDDGDVNETMRGEAARALKLVRPIRTFED